MIEFFVLLICLELFLANCLHTKEWIGYGPFSEQWLFKKEI